MSKRLTSYGKNHTDFRSLAGFIDLHEEWKMGNMYAQEGEPTWRWGELPYQYREFVKRADYVIYSYSTPIAWHIPGDGWASPDIKYSATTTTHQNRVRVALSFLGVELHCPECFRERGHKLDCSMGR